MSADDKTVDRSAVVDLREITQSTLESILDLKVSEAQRRFVADNAKSIAQAHFFESAWFRAIYADETPVGFIMLDDKPQEPEYFLWRLMIDARFQEMGFGRRAMELLIEHVKGRPRATELLTSCVQGDGSPEGFYRSLGFELTGEHEEGEAILKLAL